MRKRERERGRERKREGGRERGKEEERKKEGGREGGKEGVLVCLVTVSISYCIAAGACMHSHLGLKAGFTFI